MDITNIVMSAGSLVLIAGFFYGVFKFVFEYLNIKSDNVRREENKKAFDNVVSQLSSSNPSAQLSAAILLRRFFDAKRLKKSPELAKETTNVISALLRTISTGVYQKTLADGLAYARDLSFADLQKTNLQDAYLGIKDGRISMKSSDMFLSDLSYALLENIDGHGVIFYRSILFCTQIKNCDFTEASFYGADLTGVTFKNVILKNADFTNAENVPQAIQEKLVNGKFVEDGLFSASHESKNKTIFFSMPGKMSKEDELVTKDFKRQLEADGYSVIYYIKDDYPKFGQFNKVRQSIMRSSGMIAFGFKQINVKNGVYRPGMGNEEEWKDRWLSTPWSEVEVGMGLMKGLPILLVKDSYIKEGIFDNQLSECFVATINTSDDSRKLNLNKNYIDWIAKV